MLILHVHIFWGEGTEIWADSQRAQAVRESAREGSVANTGTPSEPGAPLAVLESTQGPCLNGTQSTVATEVCLEGSVSRQLSIPVSTVISGFDFVCVHCSPVSCAFMHMALEYKVITSLDPHPTPS